MSIDKTPSGTFKVRWRDPGGSARAQTFKRKADAVAFERTLLGALTTGDYVAPSASKITVRAWADEWLDGARGLGDGGRETYRRDLDRHILPALGDVPLAKLDARRIDAYLSGKLDAGYAASTVHRHYRTLHRMCEVAVARQRLGRNPCAVVEPPKVTSGDEMRFLSVAEVEALAGAMSDRYRALILVACYAGPRWSELVGLRRRDVDGAQVTIAGQLLRRADGEWRRDVPKTKAGRRTISLPTSVADELGAHVDAFAQPGPDGLVFTNQRGAAVERGWAQAVFKPGCVRAGLAAKDDTGRIVGAPRPHDMRHTAVALAILAGAHPKAIQARMGHASIGVTLDRYGHLFPEMDGRVADSLDALRTEQIHFT